MFDPGDSDDVIEFRYRWLGGAPESVSVEPGEAAEQSLAPPGDLTQTLQVQSIDRAGNVSDWHSYQFLVQPAAADRVHWKFDEGQGAEAAPTAGGVAYTGTLYGGTSWVDSGLNPADPASSGTALDFDGQTGYVEVPTALVTGHESAWSVTAWVFPTALDDRHTVLAQDGDAQRLVALQYEPTANGGAGGMCLVLPHADAADAAQTVVCAPADQVPAGQWSHVAAVHDPATGTVQLWIDGGPQNGEWPPGWVGQAAAPPSWPAGGGFQIGRSLDGNSSYEAFWQGRVDEVLVYQRALTEFELMQMFLNCRYADCGQPPAA